MVRYLVADLDAAVAFYTENLEFAEEVHAPPGFAMLSRGGLRLLLSVARVPGAGGRLPDGTLPEPGGWNRIALEVSDLTATVEALRDKGIRLRTGILTGVTVRQVLLRDPSGNLIELFERRRNAR